jgi:hypothetical protein
MVPNRTAAPVVIVSELAGRHLLALHRARPEARLVFLDPNHPDSTHLEALDRLGAPVFADDAALETLQHMGVVAVAPLADLGGWAGSLTQRAGGSQTESPPLRRGPIVFCPSNDTHVKMFAPIARLLPESRFLLADHRAGERAQDTLEALGIDFASGSPGTLARMGPAAVAVGNDWYMTAQELFRAVRPRGVPTVCIQEGCLDFSRERRMQSCDYPLIQGLIVLNHLQQRLHLVTGNPRFDGLHPQPLPASPMVMINSNFTYDIHEEVRETWVRDVAKACSELGVPCFVSQHPRDKGNFSELPVRRSGATVVHDHVRAASVVVTRFSTLVYEAFLLGRQVVYYNPHREDMRLFTEDDTAALLFAQDAESLKVALQTAFAPVTVARRNATELFLDLHCGPRDGRAAQRCAAAVAAIAARGDVASRPTMRERLHAWSMLAR